MTALDGDGQLRSLLSYKKSDRKALELLANRSFTHYFVELARRKKRETFGTRSDTDTPLNMEPPHRMPDGIKLVPAEPHGIPPRFEEHDNSGPYAGLTVFRVTPWTSSLKSPLEAYAYPAVHIILSPPWR
jgi:hypothetical protein